LPEARIDRIGRGLFARGCRDGGIDENLSLELARAAALGALARCRSVPSRGAEDLWLADCEGQTLGAMVLMQTRVDVLEIMNMATDAMHRRCGIGTALLRKAQARAGQLGAKWLHVGTGSTSYAQLQFYQRFGFRVHSVDRGYFIGRYAGEAQGKNGVVLKDMIRLQMPL
jgi:ribosomal protein S18 acetylase RimI-like enzyme